MTSSVNQREVFCDASFDILAKHQLPCLNHTKNSQLALHRTGNLAFFMTFLFFYILVLQQRFVPCPITNNTQSIREETTSGS